MQALVLVSKQQPSQHYEHVLQVVHFLQLYGQGLHWLSASTSLVYWYLSQFYVDIHVYELFCWQYIDVHVLNAQQRYLLHADSTYPIFPIIITQTTNACHLFILFSPIFLFIFLFYYYHLIIIFTPNYLIHYIKYYYIYSISIIHILLMTLILLIFYDYSNIFMLYAIVEIWAFRFIAQI